jgi:cell division protein FtsQ
MTPSNRRVRESAPPVERTTGPRGTVAPRTSRVLGWLRAALGVALVTGSAVTVAWVGRRHLLTSPRFATVAVEVTGNDRRPTDVLVAESGITLGTNVFAVDLEAARLRLLSDPWIHEATLARRLPGTVAATVVERKAAALVVLGDTVLATAEGEPFKKLEPGDPVDLPLVTGLRAEDLTDDREGTVRTIRRAIELAADYDRVPLARRSPLEEVHVQLNGSFSLVVGRSAMELVLGAPPFRRKLDQAARVVAELDKRGAKADAIMLDNDARPERVVVRMR